MLVPEPRLCHLTKEPLEIKNSDPVSHNTSFDPGGGNTPANPLLQPNSSVTYKFNRPIPAGGGHVQHPSLDEGLHHRP